MVTNIYFSNLVKLTLQLLSKDETDCDDKNYHKLGFVSTFGN